MTAPKGLMWAATGAAVAALLVGCAGPAQSGTVPSESRSADQAAAIADGVVSADEYETGFARYRTCLEGQGHLLVIGAKENQSYQFGIPAAAVDSGADARCYDGEFRQIDVLWQMAHQDTSAGTEAMRNCLREVGIEPEKKTEAVERQLLESGISPRNCVK